MSYYEGLPIYRAAMDVTVKVDRVVQRVPKGHNPTLGSIGPAWTEPANVSGVRPENYALGMQLGAAPLDPRHLAYLFEPVGASPSPKEPA